MLFLYSRKRNTATPTAKEARYSVQTPGSASRNASPRPESEIMAFAIPLKSCTAKTVSIATRKFPIRTRRDGSGFCCFFILFTSLLPSSHKLRVPKIYHWFPECTGKLQTYNKNSDSLYTKMHQPLYPQHYIHRRCELPGWSNLPAHWLPPFEPLVVWEKLPVLC